MLLVASKCKVQASLTGLRLGADALDKLSAHVSQVLSKASEVAKEEKVGTIKERHVTAALEQIGQ
jgi:predicted regulator of Ras-like GTPase activity (Roadblock/LC7/MglB family)